MYSASYTLQNVTTCINLDSGDNDQSEYFYLGNSNDSIPQLNVYKGNIQYKYVLFFNTGLWNVITSLISPPELGLYLHKPLYLNFW